MIYQFLPLIQTLVLLAKQLSFEDTENTISRET